jgi:hypothetical protein
MPDRQCRIYVLYLVVALSFMSNLMPARKLIRAFCDRYPGYWDRNPIRVECPFKFCLRGIALFFSEACKMDSQAMTLLSWP